MVYSQNERQRKIDVKMEVLDAQPFLCAGKYQLLETRG